MLKAQPLVSKCASETLGCGVFASQCRIQDLYMYMGEQKETSLSAGFRRAQILLLLVV